jgi:hypothetical protein
MKGHEILVTGEREEDEDNDDEDDEDEDKPSVVTVSSVLVVVACVDGVIMALDASCSSFQKGPSAGEEDWVGKRAGDDPDAVACRAGEEDEDADEVDDEVDEEKGVNNTA